MHNLRWLAVPVTALGMVFLFFGVIWAGTVQLLAATALIALAAAIWRTSTGSWPLTPT